MDSRDREIAVWLGFKEVRAKEYESFSAWVKGDEVIVGEIDLNFIEKHCIPKLDYVDIEYEYTQATEEGNYKVTHSDHIFSGCFLR